MYKIAGVQGRVRTLPLCESSREDVVQSIAQFLSPRNPFQARPPGQKVYLACMPCTLLAASYACLLAP